MTRILDAIIEDSLPLVDEVYEELQLPLKETVEEFVNIIKNSNVYLSPSEITDVHNRMSVEMDTVREYMKQNVVNVEIMVQNIKDAIKTIEIILDPVLETVSSHVKDLLQAKEEVLAVLEETIKDDDFKLNVTINREITKCHNIKSNLL